ncbi:MAG: DUF4835 family protein [Muribaculaceae bacterium]|nr:DUF4835 family protein [Muribaculaceae bacterium]MBQ1185277.1 DUF4835 family protein [Muribaculaceae bacterium]MBQ2399610.1 DUF4835 family protein [Muribaculaceae bacterium]MBQ5722682.1 DUF4835 family protein [Muribaculaceae bacterium]MBR4885977.1 DUF4835 family protein [Muribaculaceae bacterium]
MRLAMLAILLLSNIFYAHSQELNCTVEINSSQIEGTDKSVFTTLQESITEYFNTTKWTNAQFSANEKIECRFFMTIKEYDGEKFTGDIQVQLSRPVYNSNYTTTLLNFKDTKVEFTYQENEPLIFNENAMESNLTAILNFYAYMFLALDFDSFSPNGGQPYYDKAASIVQMAQSSGEVGWKAFEDTKNRSAVLSAYTDGNTKGIRTLIYNYHRKGLDEMATSPDKGRAAITESLNEIKKIYDVAPMSVALSMFKDAKLDELVNVYSKAGSTEKDQVYELLKPIYPTESSRLNQIKDPETANK